MKNKIWAEIISGETGSADRETIQSTGTTIATTSDPVIGANEKDQKAQTAGRVVEVGRVKEAGGQSAGGRADGDESSGKTTRKRNILAEIIPRSEDNGGIFIFFFASPHLTHAYKSLPRYTFEESVPKTFIFAFAPHETTCKYDWTRLFRHLDSDF